MDHKNKTCSVENHSIDILNFWSGEEVTYSVVVIQGTVKVDNNDCESEKNIIVHRINGPWCSPATTNHQIAENLNFKCILRLERGVNTFVMKFCSVQREFILHFRPRNTPFRVLPVYLICKDHDGRFQAPENEDNSIDSACERIDLGLRLVQSIVAESLKKAGYGRRTFQLQSDLDPMAPEVHVFYSDIPVKEAHTMDMKELWALVGRELMLSHLGRENHKFVAFLSSTHFKGILSAKGRQLHEDIIKNTEGYVAIAGGGLAMVGTGCLHTWATSIEEVVPRFSCFYKVDTSLFMDDSNYRGTFGGCYASTLGTTCHELSHTLDIGHTTHGIMGTEFHSIHKMFLPHEEELVNRSLLPTSCPQERTLALLRSADGVHDLRITSKGSPGTRPCQIPDCHSGSTDKHEASETLKDAMLVQELKVAWSVSEPGPRLRLRVPSVRSPATDPRSQLLVETNTADSPTAATPLDLTCSEDEAISKSKRLCTGNQEQPIPSPLNPATPDYFDPTFDIQDVSPYWPQSALALLAYSKWVNPSATEENVGSIIYDKSRRHISSTHGLRLVELRDVDSKSILHWKFTRSIGMTKFIIPEHYFFPNVDSMCIIDSIGNVLKVQKDELIFERLPSV